MPGNRVTIDILTAAGVITGSGPILPADCEETRALDGLGSFSFEMSSTDPKAALATHGSQVKIYHEDEGWTYWGIIDKCQQSMKSDGSMPFIVTGGSIGRQLVYANTKLGRNYGISGGQTLANVVGGDSSGNAFGSYPEGAALLRNTGWNRGTTDTPAAPGATAYVGRLDGLGIFDAVTKVATAFRMHVRENILARTLDLGAFGTNPNAISFESMPHPSPTMRTNNAKIYPIKEIDVVSQSTDLWNRIYPVGGGEGNGQLDLSYSTRSVAGGYSYDINSGGVEFNPSTTGALYSIKDATSIAAYGERVRPIQFKELLPMSNSAVGWRDASNMLYDLASTYLVRNKDPQTVYRVTVANLRNLTSAGAELLRCGDVIHIRYNGVVKDLSTAGLRIFLNVDANVTILRMTRKTNADGSWDWTFDVSNVDRAQTSVADQIATVFNNVYQIAYQPQIYVFQQSFFLGRRSMDRNHPTTMLANLDGNVGKILKARLTFTLTDVRTNMNPDVSTLNNGQSQNVVGTLGPSTGGASTTALAANNQALSHQHTENHTATYTQDALTVVNTGTPSGHDHNTNTHTHPEAATTVYTAAGGAHTHVLLGLVITDNTVSPYICSIKVNGVSISGSPYTAKGAFSVDVTSLLQDANGLVASQINTIIFDNSGSAGQGLMDVECQLAVTATVSSVIAV